jgi:hypothetical protein
MSIISDSEHILVTTYDNRIHINGGNSKPVNPDVGQLWYDNDKIAVWNGYSWIPVQETKQTIINTGPQLNRAIEKMMKDFIKELEEEKLMQEFPELLEAYNEYKNLLDSAKIVAKMRNSNLAKTSY